MKIDVTFEQKDYDYINYMAQTLYDNPRTNWGQSLAQKKKSCFKGEVCEKAIRILYSTERAECESFSHDVNIKDDSFYEHYPFMQKREEGIRTEIKFMERYSEQKYITFEWKRFFHLQNSVKDGLVDFVIICDIQKPYQKEVNTVEILGGFSSIVFKDRYNYMQKSKFSDSYFLKQRKIESENLGKYFWK